MHIENGLDNINLSGDMIEVGGGRPTSLVGGRFHCLTKWPAGNLKSICHIIVFACQKRQAIMDWTLCGPRLDVHIFTRLYGRCLWLMR